MTFLFLQFAFNQYAGFIQKVIYHQKYVVIVFKVSDDVQIIISDT